MTSRLVRLLHAGYRLGLTPSWRRFLRAAANPAGCQAARWAMLLRNARETAWGQAHRVDTLRTIREWQDRIPVVGYPELYPWIARILAGEQQVLTRARVRMLERTSGSTDRDKLIPYTAGLLAEFSSATGPWLADLYRHFPELGQTRAYWAISPATRGPERTPGGLPIGFADDTEYFGPLAGWTLRQLLAVDGRVAHQPDVASWQQQTAQQLLAAGDLGFLSVWSPTFLVRLLQQISARLAEHAARLPRPRRDAVLRAWQDGGTAGLGERLWPRLCLISCWTEGASAGFVPGLRHWFPRTFIQPKGLLATEGVVSFPLVGWPGAVLAVAGPLLEFGDPEGPERPCRLAHELEVGRRYLPILSTAGGLYRYRLGDLVECVGHFLATPLVRFVGRYDVRSDLCGEKVGADDAERVLQEVRTEVGWHWDAALLLPDRGDPPAYWLLVDGARPHDRPTEEQAARVLERALRRGYHYAHCRELGQLAPARIRQVPGLWLRYEQRLTAQGRCLGSIKPTVLEVRLRAEELLEPGEPATHVFDRP